MNKYIKYIRRFKFNLKLNIKSIKKKFRAVEAKKFYQRIPMF